MSLRRKAVKGVWWSLIKNFGVKSSSFIVLLFLVRLLDPEDFGLVALAGMSVRFVQIFVGNGLSQAIVQRKNLEPEHLDTAFWVNIGIGVVLTVVMILSAGQIAEILKQPALAPIISVISLSIIFGALSQVQTSILKRTLAFRALAIRSLAAEPIGGVVAVAMALNGFGVWSLVARELTTSVVSLLILWRFSDWRPGLKVSWQHFKDLFSFGISMLGTSLVAFISKQADVAVIGYFLGPAALGYYNVAYRLFRMLNQSIGKTINNVAWPVFSRLQDNTDRLRNAFYESSQVLCLMAWPVFLGLFMLAPDIVPVIFGEKWNPSIPVVQVLAFVGLLQTIMKLNGSVIVGVGKPHWRLGFITVTAVLNVIGFLIAVSWGIVAVAITYAIVGYLLAPVSIWMVRRLIGIEVLPYLRLQTAPVVGTTVMLIIVIGIKQLTEGTLGQIYEPILFIAAAISTYIISIYVLYPSVFNQVTGLIKDLRSAKRLKKSRA